MFTAEPGRQFRRPRPRRTQETWPNRRSKWPTWVSWDSGPPADSRCAVLNCRNGSVRRGGAGWTIPSRPPRDVVDGAVHADSRADSAAAPPPPAAPQVLPSDRLTRLAKLAAAGGGPGRSGRSGGVDRGCWPTSRWVSSINQFHTAAGPVEGGPPGDVGGPPDPGHPTAAPILSA